jgi:hypothetical protein
MTPLTATSWYATHLPHILPMLLVLMAVGWAYYAVLTRPPPDESDPDRWTAERDERRQEWRTRSVAGRVARRGLYALGPLLATVATGAIIYGIDLGDGHPGRALAWIHAGVGTLAALLVTYKLAELGARRLREDLSAERILDTALSFLLLVLFPPLLVTGILLLFEPSSSSLSAYAHLIASAWWTLLIAIHLRRYLGRSLRAALGRPAIAPPAAASPPVPRPAPAVTAPLAPEAPAPEPPWRPQG